MDDKPPFRPGAEELDEDEDEDEDDVVVRCCWSLGSCWGGGVCNWPTEAHTRASSGKCESNVRRERSALICTERQHFVRW